MSIQNAACCDLDVARTLSARLVGVPAAAAGAAPSPPRYASFRNVQQPADVPVAVRVELQRSPEADLLRPPIKLDSWDMMLAWGMEISEARAAFIVDSQGFVIASRGNPPRGGFDGVGAELCYVMEQVESLDEDSGAIRTLELAFDTRRLIGLRGRLTDGSLVSVGFITSPRPTTAVLDVLIEQFTRWLAERL